MASTSISVEDKYKRMTQREHVYALPDTYIGSCDLVTEPRWVLDAPKERMELRDVMHVPGLFKIFDEIIVNARDHRVRDPSLRNIKVAIDRDTGAIDVYNDGSGVDVAMHAEHGVYVPQLIFGELLTSSNYTPGEKRIVGGKNGLGAKCTAIYSTSFRVDTVDAVRGLRYVQTFRDNLATIDPPAVTQCAGKGYTRITFTPDYARFGLPGMTDDVAAVMEARVYDVAACTPQDVVVTLDGAPLKVRTFDKYMDLYLGGPKADVPRVFERFGERWEVGVGLSPDGHFRQVSFVNGVNTTRGGKHVDYVVGQIVKKTIEHVEKKRKKTLKPAYVRDQLAVFINAVVESPSFDSQSKSTLTTTASRFGSTCEIGDAFVAKLVKLGLADRALELLEFRETRTVAAGDGKKSGRVKVAKLDDAIRAGGAESLKCTLVIAEGDSAKSTAVAGISAVGKDYFGCWPIRGKPLNVREATAAQLAANKEFGDFKKIMGLKQDKVYADASELRYGSIAIMADADVDGVHIKGLIINMLETCWPSLLQNVPGFVRAIITPIVKATKGATVLSFYTLTEYEAWKRDAETRSWHIKYFKGLGTSTAVEARDYFRNLDRNLVTYVCPSLPDASESLALAFDKKRADSRKTWLGGYDRAVIVEADQRRVSIPDFVHKDLIHFSTSDTIRSIPSVCDGLKPSQRKVLFGCLKRNLVREIKVSQLSGAVAEASAYHAGDASLQGCIVAMAQDFLGSNNVNLLEPIGQFGTRLMLGKDAASPRYIFTKLSPLTTALFHPDDAPLLAYLDDDGLSIEPEYYVPILPTLLVNGSVGIGSGWSTSVPCYDPRDIVAAVRCLLDGGALEPGGMRPWYRGFAGTIEPLDGGGFSCRGTYTAAGDTLTVTELPVGVATEDFKAFLDDMLDSAAAKEPVGDAKRRRVKKSASSLVGFTNLSTETAVRFVIKTSPGYLQRAVADRDGFEADWHLQRKIGTTNMHAFDPRGRIKKYATPEDVVAEFFGVRLDLYTRRREHLVERVAREARLLQGKMRFLEDIMAGRLVVFRRAKADVVRDLEAAGYERFGGSFDHLTGLPVHAFTDERLAELQRQVDAKLAELAALEASTAVGMWRADLTAFETAYDAWLAAKDAAALAEAAASGPSSSGKKAGAGRKRKS